MKKAVIAGILILLVCIAAVSAYAITQGQSQKQNPAVIAAIHAGNYAAFHITAKPGSRMANMTQAQFNKLVTHYTNAKKVALTISSTHPKRKTRTAAQIQGQKINQVIKTNNYAAWKQATSGISTQGGSPDTSQARFNLLVKLHQAISNKDFATVKQLMQQLQKLGGSHAPKHLPKK